MSSNACLIRTESHRLRSQNVDAEFEIRVACPIRSPLAPQAGVQAPGAPAALFVTDGDLFFGTATEMTRIMHQLFGELPPLLVVGIGYGGDDPRVHGETRNRDFTPSDDAGFEQMARRMNPEWEPLLPEGRRMGGADRFLTFLVDELAPWIASHYPVAPNGHTLFGASLGGLFTTYASLTRPGAFDHFIAASPAIWWDEEMLFDIEKRTAASRSGVARSVFLGVGSLEEGVGLPWLDAYRTVTNVRRMADRLATREDPGLRLAHQVVEGETHTTVVPSVLTRGLRHAYGRTP